ncbi:hypothetical protein BC628DRAFT_1373745 [Trametes gibbosa]|nr:hypothetical protein BC628DRAFT_1373745 [Trametes gibbosa]
MDVQHGRAMTTKHERISLHRGNTGVKHRARSPCLSKETQRRSQLRRAYSKLLLQYRLPVSAYSPFTHPRRCQNGTVLVCSPYRHIPCATNSRPTGCGANLMHVRLHNSILAGPESEHTNRTHLPYRSTVEVATDSSIGDSVNHRITCRLFPTTNAGGHRNCTDRGLLDRFKHSPFPRNLRPPPPPQRHR